MASSTQYMMIVGVLGLMIAFIALSGLLGQIREQIRDFLMSSAFLMTELVATTVNNAQAFEESSSSVIPLPEFNCTIAFYPNYVETRSGHGPTEALYGLFLLEKIDVPAEGKKVTCSSKKEGKKAIRIVKEGGKVTVEEIKP